MRALIIAGLLAAPVLLIAGPQAQAPQPSQAQTELPVRRVILYKTGVGYFEHLGRVRDRQPVTLRFTSAQLNDVLKSLTALDLSQGRVTGISYNSIAPLEQRLSALRLPLGQHASVAQLLQALRGARVEITATGVATEGRLLSIEQGNRARDGQIESLQMATLVTDAGELRSFDLTPATRVRLVERDMRQELQTYLDVVGSAREQDVRTMTLATAGTGERELFVSYVSEVPIWKSTYRLIVREKGAPLLQGWAVVDNTVGEDWRNVELSLVAGAPQSFIQPLSQPYYGRRAVVPMPSSAMLTPQTHQGTLVEGIATLTGTVRDAGGAAIPGAVVRLMRSGSVVATATSGGDGSYTLTAPGGEYDFVAELPGFRTYSATGLRLTPGGATRRDAVLQVGSLSEAVTLTARTPGGGRGSAGGVVGGLPAAPPPPPPAASREPAREAYNEAAQNLDPMASAASLGDLFEYRIKEPITIARNQSALVPIVNAEIEAERVSLWNRGAGSGRPLRAVWITNSSGLTLDGGSMTVIEGNAFAGEGLIEPLKPGERRLLSYAADLGTLVEARMESGQQPVRISRVRAVNGVIIQESEERAGWTYTVRSEDERPTTLIVEHGLRPGWDLASTEKPAERTTGAARYRLEIQPRGQTALTINEVRRQDVRISIESVDAGLLLRLGQSGVGAEELKRQLEPVIEQRGRLAAIEQRIAALEQERGTISAEQDRIRQNMQALRGSSEERQLLQRYTRQLNAQEDRLEEIRRQLEEAARERDGARAALTDLIRKVSFDVSAR